MQDRVPPQNIEAEQSVLGAMLIEKEAIPKVMEILRDTDFYREAHRVIFNAMLELYNKNEAVDMITVTEILKRDNKLEDVGGIAYVTSLANAVPTAANVTYHASIIEEKSILRQLVSVSTQIASMGYEANDDVKNIIDSAESKILEISNRKKTADFTPINEIVLDSFKSIEALMGNKNGLTGLPTGFEDLDNLTSGLHGSDLSSLRPVLPWVNCFCAQCGTECGDPSCQKGWRSSENSGFFQPGNEQGAACTAYALRRSQH